MNNQSRQQDKHNGDWSCWRTIHHTCLAHDPRPSIDFGVKMWKCFPSHNSLTFWHTAMLPYSCIVHDQGWNHIDFWVKGLGQTMSLNLYDYCTITIFPVDVWYNTKCRYCLWPECGPFLFLGLKVKSLSQSRSLAFHPFRIKVFPFDKQWWCFI